MDANNKNQTGGISPWCNSVWKRGFDLVCALVLAIATLPLIVVVAILVKLTSPGPVFFHQARPGRNGRPFHIIKFRTMHYEQNNKGPVLTRLGDRRISCVGLYLRNWKLDELPQLLNVIRGDMSFVGPRPQPADLWKHFTELPLVLLVRPSITGAATLAFRHEEALLQLFSEEHVEESYIQYLMPLKMQMDLDYLQTATFFGDLRLICLTVVSLFYKTNKFPKVLIRQILDLSVASRAAGYIVPARAGSAQRKLPRGVQLSEQPRRQLPES